MNIIWKQPNNTLAVTSVFGNLSTSLEEYAAFLLESGSIQKDWELVTVGAQDFPQNWSRQEDWRYVGGAIVVDIDCAKETTRNRLRTERAPLLEALDIQFQRALEPGSNTDTAPIVAEKQRLRDITKLVDRPDITLDELKLLHPQSPA